MMEVMVVMVMVVVMLMMVMVWVWMMIGAYGGSARGWGNGGWGGHIWGISSHWEVVAGEGVCAGLASGA